MANETDEPDLRAYKVVVNDEGYYSIWRVDTPAPKGWRDGGKEGSKDECLAYIEEVWIDMTPASLRRAR